MKTTRTFRIDVDLAERFSRVTDALMVNGSEVIRQLMKKYVEEKEEELKMKINYGETIVNGKIYRLTEDAFPTNRVLGAPYTDYNDAECGEKYNFEMGAKAVDPDGKECMVYWIFQDTKCDEQKELDDYDYSEADNVKYL